MAVSPNGTAPGVRNRLLRGYGPAAALAALVVVVALLVPSRIPKTTNVVSAGTGTQAGSVQSGSSTGPAVTTAGSTGSSGSAGSAGTPGSSGSTASSTGTVSACNGQALQVPGDPYSPPCEQFSGSNGGATWQGVTSNAINVSVRLTTDQSFQNTLAQLAGAQLQDTNADNERTMTALANYFNSHFQFYGRKIVLHFFTGQGSLSNELQGYGQAAAEADATTARGMHVFADLTAESEPYATALWDNGTPGGTNPNGSGAILGFGDPYMPNFWHTQHAPYDWSVATDGTKVATAAANYAVAKLCSQNPNGPQPPAVYAGPGLNTKPRVFAGIAPENELYKVSASVFQQIMSAHGCAPKSYYYQLDLGTESQQADNLVAQMKADGVTTIICGCDPIFPVYLSGAAAQQNWFPEFIDIGTALTDQDYVGQLYNQQFMTHALGISPNAPTIPYTQTIGYAAYKTQDPTTEPSFFVNLIYLQMDMLAIGIQMAGPDLTPATFQAGMFKFTPREGPAGLWGWNSQQYTTPNDVREICWSDTAISPYNGKQGAFLNYTNNARWDINNIPPGPPKCPIPS
jgi:hypothetical protein